jgi:hypothetical protein
LFIYGFRYAISPTGAAAGLPVFAGSLRRGTLEVRLGGTRYMERLAEYGKTFSEKSTDQ